MRHRRPPALSAARAARSGPGWLAPPALGVVALIAAGALALAGCAAPAAGPAGPDASPSPASQPTTSASTAPETTPSSPDLGPTVTQTRLSQTLDHVHGLVVSADGTLLAGTHSGVVAVDAGGTVSRVGTARDDLMGMTGVPGTDSLASSGHPGADSTLPNPVGLILSDDGGLTWSTAALTGQVDFHALATDGTLVVGYDGFAGLLASTDGGQSFTAAAAIAPATLAITPGHVWATTADGLQHSTDQARTFKVVDGAPLLFLLAAGADDTLWGVDTTGVAWRSRDGLTWEERGTLGPVEALAAADHTTAYAMTAEALHVLT